MVHVNILVKGIVQGVFFRASTRDQAITLGLNGFVRNQPDGSVYMEVEGDRENIDRLVKWCHQGPPYSKVEQVTVAEGAMKEFTGFVIMR